jgi:uncharacterized protein YkwD
MNWIDFTLVLIIVLAVWVGWKKGFVRGALEIMAWSGSLLFGIYTYNYTVHGISTFLDAGAWLLPLAFVFTVIAARVLLGLIARFTLRRVPAQVSNNPVNRVFGMAPGLLNGLVAATLVAAVLLAIPVRNNVITIEARHSRIALGLANKAGWANDQLAPVFDEAVRQTMSSFGETHASHESTELHFTYDDAVVRPALETKMLELINIERAKEGLQPLQADPELSTVARAHSTDMFVRGYFAHENPEGKNPFDRMRDAHVKFRIAGENLALAQTLQLAHDNLMNSPGHRANIMNPDFGRVGIGVLDGGFYGLMISQEFRN